MLNIGRTELLARMLETPTRRLQTILDKSENCYQQFELIDPTRPDKRRSVLDVRGPVRQLQERFLRKVLSLRLVPATCSHGGVRGRSVKSNASVHRDSKFVLKADISNFYPSISHKRVYNLFTGRFRCAPDVARICTRLCTYDYHLALGLLTSPMIADQVLHTVDVRIASACMSAGLQYTRFVDDITLSGPFDFGDSGFAQTLASILSDHGFVANSQKWWHGPTDAGVTITGVRVRKSRVGLTTDYVNLIEDQIEGIRALAEGTATEQYFVTRSQLMGRVAFARWIDRHRGERLRNRVRALNWTAAEANAIRLGLAIARKRLVPSPHFHHQRAR